ncbi:RNA-binding region RNP-1 domain-containing protein [Tieghemostelium lacteum]|uniref:RNA-binding region RNP-1 domain-containing protein n=1 Tax=Tieghemostelium lacteum TaxID=361077 RepID=A0A152AAJ5_TIELA|nr:RNA-binding region RNP-1 domain-containing protein [Tieghemostelium lacteum]|eukprot:KYR03151.1 RNA-binding region RNP-1 domain-containing protein [Tieghemostelium lacteum]
MNKNKNQKRKFEDIYKEEIEDEEIVEDDKEVDEDEEEEYNNDNIEENDEEEINEDDDENTDDKPKQPKKVINIQPMSKDRILKLKEENENKGVIYMSSIPAKMQPAKLKHLLLKHGNVTRMHLIKANVDRKAFRNDMFKEGWIEFDDKRVARKIANTLNSEPMGGKLRDIHRDCLWNLRYLPKFKWHHLLDKLVTKRVERDKRLRLELTKVRKDNSELFEELEKSKHINMKPNASEKQRPVLRTFKQRKTHDEKDL